MQRVVRSSLVGLLSLAALAACGDSGDQTPTSGSTDVVHSVTVSPSSLPLTVGGTGTLAASVDADGSLDRTVTWASSNAAVASVDATGKVTGVTAGTTTIVATSKANTSISGAAVVTVTGTNGNGAIPTVTISSINQTVSGVSAPVNIGNVTGQVDVILNVDTNGGVLKSVTAMLKCGTDSVINSQTVSNLAPSAAEAAASPVTLSFNTAAFNSTSGVAALHNGTCTISANATTASGTQSATNSTTLTLNNANVILGSVTPGLAKTDGAGNVWDGTSITVAVTPVFYTSGLSATSTTVTLTANAVTHTQTIATAGPQTVTFTDLNDGKQTSTDIDGHTDAAAFVTASVINQNGPFTNNGASNLYSASSVIAGTPAAIPTFRLDTQKPLPGTFIIANNAGQNTSGNGYLNGAFRFASDSAAGYCGPSSTGYNAANAPGGVSNGTPVCTGKTTANTDNGGVDNVTVVFQTFLSSGKKTSGVTAANPSALAESQTASTYTLDMITTDALGNADTTAVGTFGVDLTPPSTFASTQTAGPKNQQIYTTTGTNGPDAGGQQFATSGITDNLSGPGPMLVAQVRNTTLTNSFKTSVSDTRTYTNTGASGTVSVGQAVIDLSPCVIGRFNVTQSAAGANALTVYSQAGAVLGYCTPVAFSGNSVPPDAAAVSGGTNASEGYFTTEIIGIDQAGNTSAPFIATIVADATGPTVSAIDLPGSITPAAPLTIGAVGNDSVDVVSTYATVHYTGAADNLRYAKTATGGVAFDNTLTRSVSPMSPSISSFIRNLAPATAGAPASSLTAGNNAQSIDVGAVDEANNTGFLNANLGVVSLGTESANSWSSTFAGGFVVAADSSTISNCPTPTSSQTTGCGAAGKSTATHPTSVNLTASASGTTGTFANPFSSVTFWRQLPSGDYVQIGSSSSATVTDTGAGNGRTWSYTLNYDPATVDEYGNILAPQFGNANVSVHIIAVGMNASGDAVAAAPITVQFSNP